MWFWLAYIISETFLFLYILVTYVLSHNILGTTEEELNRKFKKKINFHDPRFYMVRFGGIIVED